MQNWREREYFQQTIVNENIHQDSNDNGVTYLTPGNRVLLEKLSSSQLL